MYTAATTAAEPGIIRLAEDLVYRNRFVTVFFDPVVFPNGAEGRYTRISTGPHGGVAILPVRDQHVGLVRQYRYPVGKPMWEAPRGGAESADPAADAARELAEETGATEATLTSLGAMHPDTGLLDTTVHLFLAHLPTTARFAAVDEVDDAVWLPTAQVLDMAASGDITDGFTIALIARAHLRGLL